MKKLKSAFIVWIAIYPAITVILILFGTHLNNLPILLRTLVLTVILVPLMVYVLIPFWTRIIALITSEKNSS